jgi:hypothetical protein
VRAHESAVNKEEEEGEKERHTKKETKQQTRKPKSNLKKMCRLAVTSCVLGVFSISVYRRMEKAAWIHSSLSTVILTFKTDHSSASSPPLTNQPTDDCTIALPQATSPLSPWSV